MAQPKILSSLSALDTSGYLDNAKFIGPVSEANKILANGIYYFIGSHRSPTYGGYFSNHWILTVYASDDQRYVLQIAERLGEDDPEFEDSGVYFRHCNESVWTPWTERSGGGNITCDSELSISSTNPIANNAVAEALNDKANANHTHSNYLTSSSITGKLDKSGGTMTGTLTAQSNTNYTTYQVRNIALNTSAATPTGNGSILGVYS